MSGARFDCNFITVLAAKKGYTKANETKGSENMEVLTITKENFQREVLESSQPVLLDFWAGWCGPCRMMSPVIDEIAQEAVGYKVGKVNVDEQGELASAFGVMSIPTLVVIKQGKVAAQALGVRPKAQVLDMLK